MFVFPYNLSRKDEESHLKLRELVSNCLEIINPNMTAYVSVFRISQTSFQFFDSDIFDESELINCEQITEARKKIPDEGPTSLLGLVASPYHEIEECIKNVCTELYSDKLHILPYFSYQNKGYDGIIISLDGYDKGEISSTLRSELVSLALRRLCLDIKLEFKTNFGFSYSILKDVDINAIIDNVCKYFLYSKCINTHSVSNYSHLYTIISEISSMTYEKKGHSSSVVFLRPEQFIEYDIVFDESHDITDLRKTRKLLELTSANRALACIDYRTYGLSANIDKNLCAVVNFNGQFSWDFIFSNEHILSFRYGKLSIPSGDVRKNIFESIMRTLGVHDRVKIEAVQRIVSACLANGVGTTLVFSDIASKEAERLKYDGIKPKAFMLEPDQACYLAKIDGAVLIDFDLVCHSFGVILDGKALMQGNSGRGARYNSACRYFEEIKSESKTIIFVLSDDGTIDILPHYEPLISRKILEDLVAKFRNIPIKFPLSRRYRHLLGELNKYQKYLTKDMVVSVNEVIKSENEHSEKFSILSLPTNEFKHEGADDSWFKEYWYN